MIYKIFYTETYGDEYEVEADSYEEAKEALRVAIMNGEEIAPYKCVTTEYLDISEMGKYMAVAWYTYRGHGVTDHGVTD